MRAYIVIIKREEKNRPSWGNAWSVKEITGDSYPI